jgi:hypothetical protein
MARPTRKAPPDFTPPPPDEVSLRDVSNEDLELLAQLQPGLRRQIEMVKTVRSQRLAAQAESLAILATSNPKKFLWEGLGMRPTSTAEAYGIRSPITDDQEKVLDSMVRYKRTAVPSGQGAGKTNILAVAALWFLYRYEPSIVITTATTWTQVEAQLWREIHDRFLKAKITLPGKLMQTELRIGPRHFMLGISTDDVSRFQGFHAPHVLVIIDEATGVREELWDGAEAITVGRQDRIIACGNPTDPGSRFYRSCESPLWNVVPINCLNHPNVIHNDSAIIPGAVTKEWCVDRLEEYGTEDHPLYLARVLGQWPKQGEYSLVSIADVEKAQNWDERRGLSAA